MISYWAVIGRACADWEFHSALFEGIREHPADLQEHLEASGAVLSRVEVLELIQLFSRDVNDTVVRIHQQCEAVTSYPSPPGLPSIADSLNFYAVLGLACIDGGFRSKLWGASQSEQDFKDALQSRPALPVREYTYQGTQVDEYEVLRPVFADTPVIMLQDRFQKQGWWHQQKIFGACPQGHDFNSDVALLTWDELARAYANDVDTRVLQKERRSEVGRLRLKRSTDALDARVALLGERVQALLEE